MDYGKLHTSDPHYAITEEEFAAFEEHMLAPSRRRRRNILLLSAAATLLLLSSAASFSIFFSSSSPPSSPSPATTNTISRACSATHHASLCRTSLSSFPAAANITGQRDLLHVSLDMTAHRISKALYGTSAISDLHMEPRLRFAFDDCLELMEDSLAHLSLSRAAVTGAPRRGTTDDIRTWLSAALTNHDTCTDGLDEVGGGGEAKDRILERVKDLSDLVSNTLAIFSTAAKNGDFDGIPIENRKRRRRRKLLEFPQWVGRKERKLLETPVSGMKVDFIVSKDGNGTHTTIQRAVKDAPKNGTRRFVIYIKAGRYRENIKVGRAKKNLMFVGEGKSHTIIAGGRSIYDNFTTFHTATFAATGSGFIARDITFENWAGPEKHQAVALRVGSDHSVVYRCNVIGYQDTLYVHSQRQFYRECDIYGTVDFVFGNAAVILQNCSIWARKPLPHQKNTITAQNRKDPNQNTGISIHASRVYATPDLAPVASSYPTYLGRPWKTFARTVFMLTYMGPHVHPAGWLEWNGDFALDTLYYGEYMNYGPGSAVGRRVRWPGYRVIATEQEAVKFTVKQFITGSMWLPSTGVAFLSGLTL